MTTPDLASRLRASTVVVREGGAGVIWSTTGTIVTNTHVLRSHQPTVVLNDRREFPATLLRHDRARDLAVLQIAAHHLPAVEVGDSNALRAGHLVIAVGNPFGFSGVVTTGVIYSNGPRWIQASVRLAPGNSGGLLADAEGRVIGINTMIQGGLALAVPSHAVELFVRQAYATGARAA